MYFTRGVSFGILNTPIQDALYSFEMGVNVECGDRKYGKNVTFLRFDDDAAYICEQKTIYSCVSSVMIHLILAHGLRCGKEKN